jgi:hypothetical protein
MHVLLGQERKDIRPSMMSLGMFKQRADLNLGGLLTSVINLNQDSCRLSACAPKGMVQAPNTIVQMAYGSLTS